jgi:hypothetical protein
LTEATDMQPYGGTLDFNGDGIAGCCVCGWRGIPMYIDGERSPLCPSCHTGEPPKTRTFTKVGRNDPCPCESGKKYKKCCG